MGFLRNIFARPARPASPQPPPGPEPITSAQNRRAMESRGIKARFDAQFTTDDNKNHWALADAMSIDANANWMVRRLLRMRSRYEYHNNSYYHGIAHTIANYVIGTGPRLQMTTEDKRLNQAVESAWGEWVKTVRLHRTLHSMRVARLVNGEAFALLRTNPRLPHPVKLDVFEIEADQVSSPLFGLYPSQYPDQFFDGVVLDPWGRPEFYHVLRQHPGAFGAFVLMGYEFDRWPAKSVIHTYKPVRPGQQRGIPEMLPGLPLFANLRRYNLAVIGAAESAADIPLVVQTTGAPDPDTAIGEPWERVSLDARMATVLPAEYNIGQVKPQQPTQNHGEFINATLREICRCCDLPLIFASLDAQLANMSSAYIVTQPFARSVLVERGDWDLDLDHILAEWYAEAQFIEGLLPADLPPTLPHTWRWPSVGHHADPSKVAGAEETELKNGTNSINSILASKGLDPDQVVEDNARYFGLPVEDYQTMLREAVFTARGTMAPEAETADKPDATKTPVAPDGQSEEEE